MALQACAIIVATPGCWPAWLLACRALSWQCKEILYQGSLSEWAESEHQRDPSISWFSLASHHVTQSQFAFHPTWACLVHADDLSFIPSGWFQTRRFLSTSSLPCLPHVLSLAHACSGGFLRVSGCSIPIDNLCISRQIFRRRPIRRTVCAISLIRPLPYLPSSYVVPQH